MVHRSVTYNLLQNFTKETSVLEELLSYTRNAFVQGSDLITPSSLTDEPQVTTWERYIAEARDYGVYRTLKKYLVQFQFEIKENISQTTDYKKATLQGASTQGMVDAQGLKLQEPEQLQLFLYPSLAGKLPVIITPNRFDFQAIVQALSYRNEPHALPTSMGAAMIKGLNNWDRLRQALQLIPRQAVLPPGLA